MKTFYMLCGIPGSGKSTWTKKYNNTINKDIKVRVLSTDNIIELIAKEHGLTYNDLYNDISYSFAERVMNNLAKIHFSNKDDIIIWDQTNLTIKSRKKKLDLVPNDYKKVGIYFTVPKDLNNRLDSRKGKSIPDYVIERMIKTLEVPSKEEGFDEIVTINNG